MSIRTFFHPLHSAGELVCLSGSNSLRVSLHMLCAYQPYASLSICKLVIGSDIVRRTRRDDDHRSDVAAKVQKGMELHDASSFPQLGPGEQTAVLGASK